MNRSILSRSLPLLALLAASPIAKAQPFELKDGLPGLANVTPAASLHGFAIFADEDGDVWRTDGSTGGTTLLKDLVFAENLVRFGDRVAFVGDDGVHGSEPWITDGTPGGTTMLADVRPGPWGCTAYDLTVFGGLLLFAADDGVHGHEVWVADGTPGVATLVADVRPGAEGSSPFGFRGLGDRIVFRANDGTHGQELWRTDGTPAGTSIVADLEPGAAAAVFSGVDAILGGELLFVASTPATGVELFKSDGTTEGTVLVKEFTSGTAGNWLTDLTVLGDRVVLTAETAGQGRELWVTDGTEAGTQLVMDIRPGSGSSYPTGFFAAGDFVLFAADDGVHGRELWRTDGTTAGTSLVKDIHPGTAGSTVSGLNYDGLHHGGHVYFDAKDGVHGREMWRTDGTESGTALYHDGTPGPEGLGTRLWASAGGIALVEPWTSDGDGQTLALGPFTYHGVGCAGSGGFVPSLSLAGAASPGASLSLELADAFGGGLAILLIGATTTEQDQGFGCSLLVSPTLFASIPVPGLGAGQGGLSIPATIPAAAPSARVMLQAAIVDPGASELGYSLTRGAQVVID